MNIEPLQDILKIYNDKHKVLFYYLPEETKAKLNNYEYINDLDSLFLNDKIAFIQKNNGFFFKNGIIIRITKTHITIKNTRNINLKKSDYYLFKLPRKNKSSKENRKFYEELLKSLNE